MISRMHRSAGIPVALVLALAALVPLLAGCGAAESSSADGAFRPGERWPDADGAHINAHGGGIYFEDGTYYWFGEQRAEHASEGVAVYSSTNLYDWQREGLALAPVDGDPEHDLARGAKMERPKVIYNDSTGQYVMWFHLELAGQGYRAARAAVAVSEEVTGPYRFVDSFRPNGNMSRDMTLFQEDDGTAYHIYSSRENYDLRASRLSGDYLTPTEQDSLLFSEHREAPAIFERGGTYYLITSACTGWDPNEAAYHTASSIWGPWERHGNPVHGPGADTTFGGQSTFVLPVQGREDAFIFMADHWRPDDLRKSRYIWLPIDVEGDSLSIPWRDTWDLSTFETSASS